MQPHSTVMTSLPDHFRRLPVSQRIAALTVAILRPISRRDAVALMLLLRQHRLFPYPELADRKLCFNSTIAPTRLQVENAIASKKFPYLHALVERFVGLSPVPKVETALAEIRDCTKLGRMRAAADYRVIPSSAALLRMPSRRSATLESYAEVGMLAVSWS